MAQAQTGARERQDRTATFGGAEYRLAQPTAGAENGLNPHRSKKTPGLHCALVSSGGGMDEL